MENNKKKFDLLSTVEYGGCSAKLPPEELSKILDKLPKTFHPQVMVDIQTCDDAGVYKLNNETAIIFTTDFFPPVCSDPFEFGQIAAANALSDVYAMGGTPILSLNLMMFSAQKIPMDAYVDILQGGQDKINEAGALTMGGHTIDDHPPKYGLAVVGTVHPDKLITNAGCNEGDILILTKPLGTGVVLAGQRCEIAESKSITEALDQMKLLNKVGAECMQEHNATGATDITGFGLLGHAMQMANASNKSFEIDSNKLPLINQAIELLEEGCIPGAAFRNLQYVEKAVDFDKCVSYEKKMLCCDAQTSGGLLISIHPNQAEDLLRDIKNSGVHPKAEIIGKVISRGNKSVFIK
ncbi:MAG: selenide, water dikinase SelD [Bacteroidales bacterium]